MCVFFLAGTCQRFRSEKVRSAPAHQALGEKKICSSIGEVQKNICRDELSLAFGVGQIYGKCKWCWCLEYGVGTRQQGVVSGPSAGMGMGGEREGVCWCRAQAGCTGKAKACRSSERAECRIPLLSPRFLRLAPAKVLIRQKSKRSRQMEQKQQGKTKRGKTKRGTKNETW